MCSRCRPVRTFTSSFLPKAHRRAVSPRRGNTESLATDCPNAILEKPRIHPQELCLDICCCRLALIAAPSGGPRPRPRPRVCLAPGKNPDTFQRLSRGQGGLKAPSASVRVSRPDWASRSVKGLIRDVGFKRQISSGKIDVWTVW